jgi:anti-anti-sigma regulatory factor
VGEEQEMASTLRLRLVEQISLEGFVKIASIGRLVRRIHRQVRRQPCTTFLLDCTQVQDFSGYALAKITRLRQELQWQGSDLALTNCSEYVRSRLAVPLFESLVLPGVSCSSPDQAARLGSLAVQVHPAPKPALPGPHLQFLRQPSALRYWLN